MKKMIVSGIANAMLCSVVFAADAPIVNNATPAPPARGPSLELAIEAAQTAIATCSAQQQLVGVSVIDSAGVTKVVLASDGVTPRGVASSASKAQTALVFQQATSELGELVKSDKVLADKIGANSNYNVRAGGVLLAVRGEVIGAIGVGGAHGSDKDEACALAGIAKIQSRLQ